jgi:hypothetical protein
MRRTLRCLRIAVTALGLTACVLLIVLWVRSRNRMDYLRGDILKHHRINAVSQPGQIIMADTVLPPGVRPLPLQVGGGSTANIPGLRSWQFNVITDPAAAPGVFVSVPHWFPVVVAAALAALPWLPGCFSLRTLLIATTLVAVGLGLIAVWG